MMNTPHTHASRNSAHVAKCYARRKAGLIWLSTEFDEDRLVNLLVRSRVLDRNAADDREKIVGALTRYVNEAIMELETE